jgi:hypothetical protein
MTISEKLLEVREYKDKGYCPVVDYQSWRVAVLNHSDELDPENLTNMQRHNETDEVFVLLRGRCILFVGAGEDAVTDISAEDMQPFKIYNVKKAVWHTHALSEDAQVLIVENRDTTYDNSPFCELSTDQRKLLVDTSRALWDGEG